MDKPVKKRKRKFLKIVAWVLGIWALVLIVIQIALSPAVLTRLAGSFASEYIDGNVAFGKVSLSVLKNFPNINVSFDTVSVTYPSGRFASAESRLGMKNVAGRGNGADTLMSFDRFSASLNIAALGAGQIRIPFLQLEKPRIFARSYDSKTANWNILKASGKEDGDSVSSEMPKIVLGRIQFSDSPLVVYSSAQDSASIIVNMRKMQFNGRISSRNGSRKRINLRVDSMFVASRFPGDTLALALDRFRIGASRGQLRASAEATTYLATKSYGRLKVPVRLSSGISFPKDSVPAVSLKRFKADIAGIPVSAAADLRFSGQKGIYVKGSAAIDRCRVSDVLKYINGTIWKDAGEIQTDATVNLALSCDGWYSADTGSLPEISASMKVPDSYIGHKKLGIKHNLRFDASLDSDSSGYCTLTLGELSVSGKAIGISVAGKVRDLIGKDPVIGIDADASVNLDSLRNFIRKGSGIDARGKLDAEVKGTIRMSQLDPYRFADADVAGFIRSDRLDLSVEEDSLDVHIDSLDVVLGALGNTRDSSIAQGERMLALAAKLDSLKLNYRDKLFARGSGLSLKAQNAAAILDAGDSSRFYPFGGKLQIGFLAVAGADTTVILVADSDNTFRISPKKGNPDVPVLSLKSSSGGIYLRGPVNRIGLRKLEMDATAAMNSIERRQRGKAFADSLAKRYPDVPRDSLFNHLRSLRGSRKIQLPDWLSEEDFMKKDLQFKLDSSVVKTFMTWDAEGSMKLAGASVISPYFPLRNSVRNLEGSFNNNEIALNSLELQSGRSNMSVKGKVKGIRGLVAGRGMLALDMDVASDSLNLNELLGAYSVGSRYVPAKQTVRSSTDSLMELGNDREYQDSIVTDTLSNVTDIETSLLVVPANINARITLDASDVRFSTLLLTSMQSQLTVKERCVQFMNTSARSDIGNIDFEGFYSTRTKKDLSTGFDLNLSKVTAEKVIEMVPAVDSLMPMLKSFKGELDCQIAATADIDTCMNIIVPSIKGVIRIGGKSLELQESDAFYQIAKKLKFKDKQNGYIEKMSVEGVISDNRLEVFPFILKLDRYTLAMSGVQNLDMSFRYHISVLDSPIPFRVGIDLYGDNFDDFRFKIGKAKYKSTDIPVFSSVIDQTRLSLKASIEKIFSVGVEKALQENARLDAIRKYKEKIDYSAAVNQQLDSLSAEEKAELGE